MCLAVPMRIESVEGDRALADADGCARRVSLMLLPDVRPGDYVLVHAGFAIQRLDEARAQETIELLRETEGR